jgi:pyridoxamine 5'-phosphate oxidase
MNWIEDISGMRQNYTRSLLDENNLLKDPFEQFRLWFNEAFQAGLPEVNAMTLATAGVSGRPSARVVLLKRYGRDGFVFFTNYESRKAQQLRENPYASISFFWAPLERQVRIEGMVSELPAQESDAYFGSRPHGSRLGAYISQQSRPLASRDELTEKLHQLAARFEHSDIPRPSFWGGYILSPDLFEFWQGRPDRLHDRFEFIRNEADWDIQRLSP